VVLDDVTNYQAIEPYLPPADPRFKLLITTRLDLGSTVQKVPLEELSVYGGESIPFRSIPVTLNSFLGAAPTTFCVIMYVNINLNLH
jgi:hypothetical protein